MQRLLTSMTRTRAHGLHRIPVLAPQEFWRHEWPVRGELLTYAGMSDVALRCRTVECQLLRRANWCCRPKGVGGNFSVERLVHAGTGLSRAAAFRRSKFMEVALRLRFDEALRQSSSPIQASTWRKSRHRHPQSRASRQAWTKQHKDAQLRSCRMRPGDCHTSLSIA